MINKAKSRFQIALIIILLTCRINAFGQWIDVTQGIEGTHATGISFNNNKMALSSYFGGTFYASNNFNYWTHIDNGLPSSITDDILYFGNRLITSVRTYGIYISDDNGQNWTCTLPGSNPDYLGTCDGYIYAFFQSCVRISNDGGNTWTINTAGLPTIATKDWALDSDYVYASNSNGIFRAPHNMSSWASINNDLPYVNIERFDINDSLIVALGFNKHIYCSYNKGLHWIDKGPSAVPRVCDIKIFNDTVFFASLRKGICYSLPGDLQNWTQFNNGLTIHMVEKIILNDSVLYALTLGGPYKLTGNLWQPMFEGLHGIFTGELIPSGNKLYLVTSTGLYRSDDFCNNWINISNGIPNYVMYRYPMVSGDTIVVSSTDYGLYMSINAGNTWVPLPNSPVSSDIQAMNFSKHHWFVADSNNFYHSSDGCQTWSVSPLPGQFVFHLTNDSTHLFMTFNAHGVYSSVDNGMTWNPIGFQTTSIMTIKAKDDTLYINTFYKLYRSVDNGLNWQLLNSSVPIILGSIEKYGNTMFFGGDAFPYNQPYIYASTDEGSSFFSFQGNLPHFPTGFLKIIDSYLFASLNGAGLWRRLIDSTSTSITSPQVSSVNIYPNPVKNLLFVDAPNLQGVLDYQISDMVGRIIISGNVKEEQNRTINTASLQPGLYYILLSNRSGTLSRRFLKIQ